MARPAGAPGRDLALDRKTINQALTLGHSHVTGSIVPDSFEFYWQPPAPVYDPAKAKELLAEAGFPNGFDAGDLQLRHSYANMGEAAVNNLRGSASARSCGRWSAPPSISGYAEKKLKNIIQAGSGAFGNAATRLEAFVVKGGAFVYGSYPDIDELFPQQADELDHGKRAAILDKMQQLVHERTIVRADLAACLPQRRRAAGRRSPASA